MKGILRGIKRSGRGVVWRKCLPDFGSLRKWRVHDKIKRKVKKNKNKIIHEINPGTQIKGCMHEKVVQMLAVNALPFNTHEHKLMWGDKIKITVRRRGNTARNRSMTRKAYFQAMALHIPLQHDKYVRNLMCF